VCKDPANKWSELPFVAIDDVIFNVLETWLPEWRTPDIAEKKKKEEAKLRMVQLAEKRRQETTTTKV